MAREGEAVQVQRQEAGRRLASYLQRRAAWREVLDEQVCVQVCVRARAHVYVRVCACMQVCVCVCGCACAIECVCACARVYRMLCFMSMFRCGWAGAAVDVLTYPRIHFDDVCMCVYVCARACVCVRCMHRITKFGACVRVRACVCMRACATWTCLSAHQNQTYLATHFV